MQDVSFAQLQAFVAVARSRNFTKAARELGVSRSAVSQSVQQLEEHLGVVLLRRTTRSVALTELGARLIASVEPALKTTVAALTDISTKPGEVVGQLRLSVPQLAVPLVLEPVLPVFRARHPGVQIEVSLNDELVDIVAEGFDAGIRLVENIERDIVHARVFNEFPFLVVGTPDYFARRGRPKHPKDLLEHECISFRSPTSGALYAWEFERGAKSWRVPVKGKIITNAALLCTRLAKQGLGLAYAPEPWIRRELERGELEVVLRPYAPVVPGLFLHFPSRSQRSEPLRLFIETAKEVLQTAPQDSSGS